VKIGIIGPGALGCLFASRLFLIENKQNEILLIDHNPDRAAMLNDQGIFYESGDIKQLLPIPLSSTPVVTGHLDALFFCVKSHDLEQSLTFVKPLISPSTLLIFLQNGISHLQFGEKDDIQGIPVFATSSEGATTHAPGHIKHAGKGKTYLGFLSQQQQKDTNRLQQLVAILQEGDITSRVSSDILSRVWAKLFVNVGINALTAIYNCTNGALLTLPDALNTMKGLVDEAAQVAQASGITIMEDPIEATITVCKQTAKNKSSMLQDVHQHRPTEIDAINGAISLLGRENNIATPHNDDVISQVKTIEKKYHENTTP
jgi:2-dehydropantoate 2-reductase